MQDKTNCDHPTTVELYFGITKCTTCGDLWDEADDDDVKAKRGESQTNAIKREERRQAIIRNARKGRIG